MDKIYSRKGIRIQKKNKRKISKITKTNWIVIILFVVMIGAIIVSLKSFLPIFETACLTEAKSIATQISNEEADKLMKTYIYEDLVYVEKDENGKITMIRTNVGPINNIMSDIAIHVQEKLDAVQDRKIFLKAGSFSGVNIFSGLGPNIPIKILTNGTVETNLKSEFQSVGVNQTLHRIYAELDTSVQILTPFQTMEEKIRNQILITESVILGEVPSTYYNVNRNSGIVDENKPNTQLDIQDGDLMQ